VERLHVQGRWDATRQIRSACSEGADGIKCHQGAIKRWEWGVWGWSVYVRGQWEGVVVVGESYQSVWLWDVGGRKEEEGKRREEKKIYPRWQAQDSDHKQQHNNNNKTMTPSGTVQRTVMNLLGVGALPRYDGVGDEGSRVHGGDDGLERAGCTMQQNVLCRHQVLCSCSRRAGVEHVADENVSECCTCAVGV
jgi:hypothetical protein